MKVLHTISGLNKGSGGPTTCTYNMVKGLRRTGIDAKILTLAPANSNDSIISNEEYIKAVVDAEGRLLFGIKTDGSPYYPKNDMYRVVQNDEYLYAMVDQSNRLLIGIRHDGEIIEGKIPFKTRQEIEHVKTELSRNVLAVEMDRATGRIIGHTGNDSRIKSCVQDRVTGIITINQVIE